ncbi:unnamed protein product, partial [marine sediment metagenome]
GFAIANVEPLKSSRGVPYIAALPRIASEADVKSSFLVAERLRLCSGRYYALCDESGEFVGLESNGHDCRSQAQLHTHTNHYIFGEAAQWEGRREYGTLSERRRISAERRLGDLDQIDADSLLSLVRYHDGTPESILQTGEGRKTRTGACFVIDPSHRLMWYTSSISDYREAHSLSLEVT